MPYQKAWLFVLSLLALTFVAFWPSYLSQLPGALWAHHAHAASAVLWTVLAISQAWSIHHGRWDLHRTTGLAVFVLFPFFLISGLWVIHLEATRVANALTNPGMQDFARFGVFFDPLSNLGYAILFWGGLRFRYHVQLHARYMLGTIMFVVAPVFWRLLQNFVPAFGQSELPFDYPFALGNLGAFAIAIALYLQAPKHGRPFVIVAAIIAIQSILFITLGRLSVVPPLLANLASFNLPLLLVLTAIVSVAICWHGWMKGARPKQQLDTVPAR